MIHATRRDVLCNAIPAALTGAGLASVVFGQVNPAARPPMGEQPSEQVDPGHGSLVQRMLAQSCVENQYRLPSLPYPYNALDPHIDEETMHLHHDKHHQAYVDGLNQAIRQIGDLQVAGEIDPAKLAGLQRDMSFNAGGHLLHTVFWATMSPGQSDQPRGMIAEALQSQYGSLDGFLKYFNKVAASIKGSGWALLSYEPVGDKLLVCSVNEHDVHLVPTAQPLLPLDVWEHAYYLKYQNRRAEYIENWWQVVNWTVVDESYRWMRGRSREAAMITSGR